MREAERGVTSWQDLGGGAESDRARRESGGPDAVITRAFRRQEPVYQHDTVRPLCSR